MADCQPRLGTIGFGEAKAATKFLQPQLMLITLAKIIASS